MTEPLEVLEHHTKKQKESLMQTIGTRLRLGLDELMRTVGVGSNKKNKQTSNSHQITSELEKYENKLITKKRGRIG